jgi:3-phosphoshikimate 1-carboxyvinyltransferase
MPMASAQVKSCLLLAGMYAQGETTVTEPAPTRDHTERMLKGFGYPVSQQGNQASINANGQLTACDIDVPSDISSAAFFLVGASIAPNSNVLLKHVGINPTRTGVIDILRLMGANIEILNEREVGGEPVADLRVTSSQLKGIEIPEHLVPLAIDEFPVLFIAAACATGETTLTGAEELRVKESDRIQVMADGLLTLGVNAKATPDGMIIQGQNKKPFNPCKTAWQDLSEHSYYISDDKIVFDSHGDHRLAMSAAIAGLYSMKPIEILQVEFVNTSFPSFFEILQSID